MKKPMYLVYTVKSYDPLKAKAELKTFLGDEDEMASWLEEEYPDFTLEECDVAGAPSFKYKLFSPEFMEQREENGT